MRKPDNRGGIRTYLLLIALVVATATATPLSILAGCGLLLLSFIVQFWSKGCLHQNRQVTQTGPYRFVRHPFYMANALLDASVVVMSGCVPLAVLAPIWWLLVYLPVMRREEAHLTQLFGDDYRRYAARVPRFIPWRKPLPAIAKGFSWTSQNILGTEVARALRYLSYPFMFYISMRVGELKFSLLTSPSANDVAAVVAIGSLFAAAQIWRNHFRAKTEWLPELMMKLPVRLLLISAVLVVGFARAVVDPVEQDWGHWLPGLLVLAGSMMFGFHRPLSTSSGVVAEGLFLAALLIFLELGILAIPVFPLYLALSLDLQLLTFNRSRFLVGARFAALVLIGVCAALLAEFI